MNGARWFSTFDLCSGYHQVLMDDDSRDNTTFVTRKGTFRFRVMPFWLTGAPATFQRLMDLVMCGLNIDICLVYLDDIIVFAVDVTGHLNRLPTVFGRLQAAGLKLKPSKCRLFQRRVTFLGHVVSHQGIETDPEKITSVASWPVPRSLSEVRSFVGLASYYRRFVPGFASIAAPLHALTSKAVKFRWDEHCQTAFEQLKLALTSSRILAMPTDLDKYILDTNASDTAIGAVLS